MSNFLERYTSYFVHYPSIEKDHKRINDAFEGGYYTSLSRYHEAVIRTDRYASILRDRFEYLMFHVSRIFPDEASLVAFLNKQFESHMIVFKTTNKDVSSSDYDVMCGIEEMRCNPVTKEIQILTNNNFRVKFFNKDSELLETFYELILHELVHRGKSILSNYEALQKEFKKFINSRKSIKQLNMPDKEKLYLDARLYLSRKDEIMAYANQIVQEMRFNGFSDKYIIDHAKRFDISEDEAFPLKNYYVYFRKDDSPPEEKFCRAITSFKLNKSS